MNEIDNLSGIDLARAVAEAQGWQVWTYDQFPYCLVGIWRDSEQRFRFRARDYRPDRDMAQAWELSGEGWYWKFRENRRGDLLVYVRDGQRGVLGLARVDFADFPTPSAAYATARCRAWLMARAAETAHLTSA